MVNQVKTRSSKEFRQDDFYQIRREVSNNVIAVHVLYSAVRTCMWNFTNKEMECKTGDMHLTDDLDINPDKNNKKA